MADSARNAGDLVRRCFAEPLVDLGATDVALQGLFAPAGHALAPRRGVTSQFLEHAADYAERYGNLDHFRVMLDDALARLDPPLAPRVVLDIGSGAGNSVLPLLDRYADAFVIATDVSPQLLAILRDRLAREPRYAGRYALVCVDACHARYRPQVFDLVVGAAILHHLPEPAGVVAACGQALAPAGAAIFFEPFELGHAVLHVAYADLLAEAAHRGDRASGFAMLRQLAGDYAARRADPTDPRLLELDDKWMFSRSFFEDAARRGRYAECIVYPTHASAAPLTEQTRVNLRLGMDLDADALPAWAWARLTEIEQAFSPAARRELMFEGAVVLRASAAALPADPGRAGWWYDASAPGRGFFVELRDAAATIVCCHYADDGAPIWHFAGPAPVHEGRVTTTASPGDLPFILRFADSDRAVVEWDREQLVLTPQHPGSASWTQTGSGIGGFWLEDAATPALYAAIEELADRLFVALLGEEGWWVCVATRRAADAYAGEWLRFSGGQALGAPYRAPAAPEHVGAGRIMRLPTDRLVVQRPGGAHCILRRGVGDTTAPEAG